MSSTASRILKIAGSASLAAMTLVSTGCGSYGSTTAPVSAQTATPTFSVAAGTYSSVQTVAIADTTAGATIHYTTDGSTPTVSSPVYSSAIAVNATTTIMAMAIASGETASAIASAQYVIQPTQAAVPTFSPAAGAYSSAQTVTIADATGGATIHYTTDGSTPTASSAVYSSAIVVNATTTIRAIAIASGDTASPVGSAAYVIGAAAVVTVNQANPGLAVTDQIMGVNMAYWYDQSNPAIGPAFATAGIKAIRWPGGSGSDVYHWQTNSLCGGAWTAPAANWPTFLADVVEPTGVDLAVTANYGTNEACNGGGDPAEAAAWVTAALNDGNHVSHWTVGNEVYGTWETDMHAIPNDPTTYAHAVATGYYPQMKAANPNTLVGVVVEPNYNWDSIVLSQANYDFVEFHYYAQQPGQENDTYLVQQAAQDFTSNINAVKADLSAAGHASTPIYVGELGSVAYNPGIQTSSITQALYAGQILGELMKDGVSRATWWIGFGGCVQTSDGGNFSNSLYGWEDFGGYMVFSDGMPEYACTAVPTIAAGTLLPTARALQLFSDVAKSGEHVLNATVSGDTTDVRAYAATNNGGTALVLFNLNETASKQVGVTLSSQTSASSVTVETYDKAIYDQAQGNVWAGPTTVNLGQQALPLTLTLSPWSMNVVIVH